jgi:hypothetical protein
MEGREAVAWGRKNEGSGSRRGREERNKVRGRNVRRV